MQSKLQVLRDKIISDYKNAPYRIVSDFKNEASITKDYNSRQLLEMLQNADDASSTEVSIVMDTDLQTLTICNKGQAFSYEGFESLMIPNYTSKTSGAFIGNKGLGFRSLLNWASEVSVYSASCKVSFSTERAQKVLFDEVKITSEALLEMNKRGGFSEETIPFPIMASPEIISFVNPSKWTTIIEIKYHKKYEGPIISQLGLVKEEILLFLNHIEKIEIIKDKEILKSISSKKENFQDYSIINIGDKKWTLFGKTADLPQKLQDSNKSYKQQYSIKIAFQDDLSDDYKQLFNFFPTKVNVHLPCILHGTFELNNSRDHLNDSDVNRFIIAQYAYLFDNAVKYLKIKETNWLPYKLVNPIKEDSDSSIIPLLYQLLKEYTSKEKIFPCLDGTYRKVGDYHYYGNQFHLFVENVFRQSFGDFLIPTEIDIPVSLMAKNLLKELVDKISKTAILLDERAELIYQLSKVIPFYGNDNTLSFDILINKDLQVISSDDIAFTPLVNQELAFEIPHQYVSMDVISVELYLALNKIFKESYKKNETEARELQRCIRSICNIQPYDSSNVIDKIITSFKQYVLENRAIFDKKIAIKIMIKALFSIYKSIDRKTEVLNQNILLLNFKDEFVDASTLYLANSYSNEQIIKYCYKGYLNESNFLKEISFWELEQEDSDLIESFFNWLGVNSFLRTEQISLLNKQEYNGYFELIKKEQSLSSDFNVWRILQRTQVTKIKDFEGLLSIISKEKLLILVYFETKLKRLVLDNSEEVEWSFSNSNRVIKTKISFINFQFIDSKIYSDILLQSLSQDTERFLNNSGFEYSLFRDFGIEKIAIEQLLTCLGAKKEFKELSIKRIYQIISEMPNIDEDKNGKGTLTLYTKLIESLVEKAINPEDFQSYFPLRLFGRKGDEKGYFDNADIKYIANSIFSNQILQSIPLINLPKRYSEANILQFLGVSSLKESDILIDENSLEYNVLNHSFSQEIEKYKPYILIYRLFSENLRKPINEESQRIEESSLLKRLNIVLVDSLKYTFQGIQYLLAPYDFISNGHTYYIHIPADILSVSNVFKDSLLCDALAEILCIQFKINDLKTDFRFVIKNDLNDTNHIVSNEFGDHQELINILLGLPKPMLEFWNKLFYLPNINIETRVFKNERDLQSFIKSSLNIEVDVLKIDYINFSNLDSYNLSVLLTKNFNITIQNIRENGLLEWHNKGLMYCFNNKEKFIDSVIWKFHSLKKDGQKYYIENARNVKSKINSKLELYLITNKNEKFSTVIDYENVLIDSLSISLKEINIEFETLLDSQIFYPKILYNDLLSKYKTDKNELVIAVQSLLYFENNEVEIEAYLNQNLENNTASFNEKDYSDAELIQGAKIRAPKKNTGKHQKNGSSHWNSKKSDDANNRNIGKEAETVAYNALIKKYGFDNVKWQSSNSDTPDRSDSLHYDILYKNDSDDWKKLEVKNYNGRYFKISKDEVNLGLSVPLEFEIGLVEENRLFIVNDFFVFNDNQNFYSNDRFNIESNNFTIYYTKEND